MYKVLIADDELWLRKRLIATLPWEELGIDEVLEAEDGAEALMLAIKHEPDIIISDIEMPELTGIDLLRRLRAEGFTTPLGFVTSEGSPEMRELADREGALFLIAKPFTPEGFREVIEPVLA